MNTVNLIYPKHAKVTALFVAAVTALALPLARGAAPTLLFQDDFNTGIPGWFAVRPSYGAYIDGPMLWQYDKANNAFSEGSNIYTETSGNPPNRVTVMLINNVNCPANFTYSATVTAGDDDGFGLILGYENESTFWRLEFATQASRTTGWPYVGWCVDRMNDRAVSDQVKAVGTFLTVGTPQAITLTVTNVLGTNYLTVPELGVADFILTNFVPGKVGIFSWGQAGNGGGVRSFRIQNPFLTTNGVDNLLAGNPAAEILTNWTFDITLSLTSNPTGGSKPNWSQGINANGATGTMIENSDWTVENVVRSYTNCPTPVAVAGDVNWSNYVYSARFITRDDDGFGMVLRYKDVTNFYRIAFRNQSSAAGGIRRGISIQKVINQFTFDQLLSSTTFIPPINTPIDVYASIRTNRLQVNIVSAPTSSNPSNFFFGPFDITGATVDNGKVGIFSWAQYNVTAGDPVAGTEVDSVQVNQLTGEGLVINSAYGTPDPPVGLTDYPIGSLVTAKVDTVVFLAPGVRKGLIGFSGSGSAPASGTTNEISFNLNSLSSVTWKWRSEYLVTVSATPGGTAGFLGSQYLPEGTNITIIATNNPGYVFVGWSGTAISQKTNLSYTLTTPLTLIAKFAADSDGDGLPDEWEMNYFGNLAQTATGDPDGDGNNNLAEYLLGSNPTVAEPLTFTDGLSSRWINETLDRGIPGWFVVTNFGGGFRGLWEVSNQNEGSATPGVSQANSVANVSFQGPYIAVRSNVWNDAWSRTNSIQFEYSVGDDDGVCFYWRYNNVSNYYRLTIDDQTQTTVSPLAGVTVQMRTNGVFALITPTVVSAGNFISSDPLDGAGYKRFRITLNCTNEAFEIHVAGWDRNLGPPDWNTNQEKVLTFADTAIPTGRIAIGDWGMSTFGSWNATVDDPPTSVFNPIGAGFFADNLSVTVDGTAVFSEDWETATLHYDFPVGWENPYSNAPPGPATIFGDWHLTAHGTIGSLNNTFGGTQSGSSFAPKGDAEGPIFLAPQGTNGNYILQVGVQPWDDGGMGFVYDFLDTNNYARVLFDAQAPLAGQMQQGLNVGRKTAGVWKDIVVGDKAFVYTPGKPFEVRFANNNGIYTLLAWNSDTSTNITRWQWNDQAALGTNRFGLAVWNMPDAHYNYLRALGLNTVAGNQLNITKVAASAGTVTLTVTKPLYSLYAVQRATVLGGPWTTAAVNQNGLQYTEAQPADAAFYRLLQQ